MWRTILQAVHGWMLILWVKENEVKRSLVTNTRSPSWSVTKEVDLNPHSFLLWENTILMFCRFFEWSWHRLFLENSEDSFVSVFIHLVGPFDWPGLGHVPTWESLKLHSVDVLTYPHGWGVKGRGRKYQGRRQGWILARAKKGSHHTQTLDTQAPEWCLRFLAAAYLEVHCHLMATLGWPWLSAEAGLKQWIFFFLF